MSVAAPISLTDHKPAPVARPAPERLHCGRCGNRLASFYFPEGSTGWVEDRCHHSIRRADGTRGTCGFVTRTGPSR